MAKAKGSPKTGGRKAGTPNKVQSPVKRGIINLLTNYHDSGQFERDFLAMDARDRVLVSERLAQYVVPKQQATSVGIMDEETRHTIEDSLAELSGDD